MTAIHTVNKTVAKGFNQMTPPARIITVALDRSKAFDTINIHTLIRKLLQTNIPRTIIKLIANYFNGHEAYTRYRNHTSSQRQFKTGVPQGGILSLTLFNIYMAYADDITITSTHKHKCTQIRINKSLFFKSYLHKIDAQTHPSPLCPLCNIHTYDTHHLFNFTHKRTTLSLLDLWTDLAGVMELLARWKD